MSLAVAAQEPSPSSYTFQFSSSYLSPSARGSPHARAGHRSKTHCSSNCKQGVDVDDLQDQEATANPDCNLHQVLELALLHAQDIKALAGASTVNNHFHDFVQDAARLHPHALLAAWTESATATRKAPPAKLRHGQQQLDDCRLKCLLWLCRAVGEEFVNSHGVASALLRLTKTVPDLKPDDLVEVLREAGLDLTDALLVYACKEQLPNMPYVVRRLCRPGFLTHFVYRAFALFQRVESAEAAGQLALTPTDFARRVQKLLPRVTASNLVDLLHMTTSYAVQGRATTAATLLLNHDRDHLHVLHLKPARTSHHNNPAPHVPAHSASESNEEQQYQQQVAAAKCIAQVMQTCIAINNEAILNILLALPAAQFIEVPAVVTLLHTAIKSQACIKQHASSSTAAHTGSVVPQLRAALPWAQAVPAADIERLLADCIKHQAATAVAPLLGLPDAKDMDAGRVLQLLPAAANAGLADVARELGRFAVRLQPSTADVAALLKAFISNPWSYVAESVLVSCSNYSPRMCFMDLSVLGLWDNMSGEDLLELLELCTASRTHIYPAWNDLVALRALSRITDSPRFLRCVKAAVQVAASIQHVRLPVFMCQITRQLQLDEWFDVMQCSLQSPLHCLHPDLMMCIPTASDRDQATDCITQLLQLAAARGNWEAVMELCDVPAAEDLSPAALTLALQELLLPLAGVPDCSGDDGGTRSSEASSDGASSSGTDCRTAATCSASGVAAAVLNTLLWLPAAEDLAADTLGAALDTAVSSGSWDTVKLIASLPAAQQLSPAAVGQALSGLMQGLQHCMRGQPAAAAAAKSKHASGCGSRCADDGIDGNNRHEQDPYFSLTRQDIFVAVSEVLCLSPAQDIRPAGVHELLQQAWRTGCKRAVELLCESLPHSCTAVCVEDPPPLHCLHDDGGGEAGKQDALSSEDEFYDCESPKGRAEPTSGGPSLRKRGAVSAVFTALALTTVGVFRFVLNHASR